MIGEQISRYRILERLGRGGMGVVYRAEDTRLGRQVALKFLPDDFVRSAEALDRFVREARSAAALNHPHICTIYEIDEQAERPFIAMELLEGRTLSDVVAGGPMPLEPALELGIQIASALEAAHAKGIVHRDIKPANIFVTTTGLAKVLDFGLAKEAAPRHPLAGAGDMTAAAATDLTHAGSTLGTIAYMSPEQARGQALDTRSDLFSFGLVLYEMLTGRQAFGGETTAVMFDGILNRTPAAPSGINPLVPPELERIVARAIEKDRTLRYQSAADLGADLRRVRKATESGAVAAVTTAPTSAVWPSASHGSGLAAAAPAHRGSSRRLRLVALVALVIVLAGVAAWQFRGTTQALGESDLILLADFQNETGDPVFDGTLKQALAVKLEESPYLNVLSEQRVRETLRFMNRPPETPVTQTVAREICERQGVKALMSGAIASLGSTYVVTLTAEQCRTGDVLAREQVSAPSKEQVLAALGEAASAMRMRLGESLASIARTDTPIEEATTSSLEALKAYSLGSERRNTVGDQESIPFFRRALELDPDFALAHAQLGTAYANLGEGQPSIEHRTRAYELRDRVSERERLYILAHYYSGVTRELDRAADTYELWKQTYPRDPVPRINMGTIHSQRGEPELALQETLAAIELDPMRRIAYGNAFSRLLELNRIDEAKELVERQVAAMGESPETRLRLYQLAGRRRDREAAAAHFAALEHTPMATAALGMRASEMLYHGRLREARALTERQAEILMRQGLRERAAQELASLASAVAMMGDLAPARELTAAALKLDPTFDGKANAAFALLTIRDEPRARRLYNEVLADFPPDSPLRDLFVRGFEGLAALLRDDPHAALQEVVRADTSRPVGPAITILMTRGEAERLTRDFAAAESTYRTLLARPEVTGFATIEVFARLGLARTLASIGNGSEARIEYERVLESWREADPGVPMIEAARGEYAQLTT